MRWMRKVRNYRAISIRRLWRFVALHVGHRGAVMAFLTLLDVIYGYSLNVNPGPLDAVDLGLPIRLWSLIWIAVGVILASGVSANRDKFHYGLAVALKVAWSSVLIRAWMTGDYTRGWVTAAIWASFGMLLIIISSWPEGFVHKSPLKKKGDSEE